MPNTGYVYQDILASIGTKDPMTMQIGDHKFICKIFDDQDKTIKSFVLNAYEQSLLKLAETVKILLKEEREINETAHLAILLEIKNLRDEVKELRGEVKELSGTVDCTKREVVEIKRDVERLKKLNSMVVIAIRIVIGVIVAIIATRLIHGPW